MYTLFTILMFLIFIPVGTVLTLFSAFVVLCLLAGYSEFAANPKKIIQAICRETLEYWRHGFKETARRRRERWVKENFVSYGTIDLNEPQRDIIDLNEEGDK